jgi:trehalose utilization protein
VDGAPVRAVVWGENVQEHTDPVVGAIYPAGMHTTIAEAIREHLGAGARVTTATLDQPQHGLTEALLAETDVLTWWGHVAHARVDDDVVQRVYNRVRAGMGLVVLHSGHESKIFKRLMGTTCSLRWREAGEREVVWTVNPGHPVARGVPEPFVIPEQAMYGEYFDIPQPDELVFISSFRW